VAPADTGMLSVAKPKKKKITHIAQLQSNDLIWYRRAILGHYISMELMSDVQQQQCKEGDLFSVLDPPQQSTAHRVHTNGLSGAIQGR